MFRGDWGNTTNKQMPRIGDTDSWHFCKVWPHMPCLLLMCPYKLSRDSKYFILTRYLSLIRIVFSSRESPR